MFKFAGDDEIRSGAVPRTNHEDHEDHENTKNTKTETTS